jgi:hypothetical protein
VTTEIPRYRAVGRIFLSAAGPVGSRIIEAGAAFDYDGVPDNSMRPLNAAARAAKLKSIPSNWRAAPHPGQIRRLARSLGFAGGTTSEATAFIENFIETEIQKETTP